MNIVEKKLRHRLRQRTAPLFEKPAPEETEAEKAPLGFVSIAETAELKRKLEILLAAGEAAMPKHHIKYAQELLEEMKRFGRKRFTIAEKNSIEDKVFAFTSWQQRRKQKGLPTAEATLRHLQGSFVNSKVKNE